MAVSSSAFPPARFLTIHPESVRRHLEKGLRVQIPHRIPEPRAGVRLPEEFGDRGEDQQDQVVPETERCPLLAQYKWCVSRPLRRSAYRRRADANSLVTCRQDDQAVEGVREVAAGRRGEQPLGRLPDLASGAGRFGQQHTSLAERDPAAGDRLRDEPPPTAADAPRHDHRRRAAEDLRKRARLPHQLRQRQLGRGDVHQRRRPPDQPLESLHQRSELQ